MRENLYIDSYVTSVNYSYVPVIASASHDLDVTVCMTLTGYQSKTNGGLHQPPQGAWIQGGPIPPRNHLHGRIFGQKIWVKF